MENKLGFISGDSDVSAFYVENDKGEKTEVKLGSDGAFQFEIMSDGEGALCRKGLSLAKETKIKNPTRFLGAIEGESVYCDGDAEKNVLGQKGTLIIRYYIDDAHFNSFNIITFRKFKDEFIATFDDCNNNKKDYLDRDGNLCWDPCIMTEEEAKSAVKKCYESSIREVQEDIDNGHSVLKISEWGNE